MKRLALPLIGLLLLAGTAWLLIGRHRAAPPPPPPPPVAVAPPVERYPLAGAAQADAKLPEVDDSDALLGRELGALAGPGVVDLLATPRVLRKFVATVDNLPRSRLAVELRPVHATPGQLAVQGGDTEAVLDSGNDARYQPALAFLRATDTAHAAELYRRYYPLLQRAYQDLGYPDGHFNDRLVSVIDLLLATPQPAEPIRLVRPKVYWQFADPALEQLASGQKLLIRLGPANAAFVRQWLQGFRAQIVAH